MISPQILYAQLAGSPGSFSRVGFGARGIGMGNALTAITSHDVASYYNPALPAFAEQRSVNATYSFLALDRRLSFLSYTQPIRPTAGLSVGLIYAGVRNIDGRDSDGEHTADYSTSEYQFFFAFSNRFSDQISVGVAAKLYYNNLFRDATSTTVGLDVGALYKVTESISVGAAVQEINTKYRWDTSKLFGRNGNTTTELFPLLRRIGVSYRLPDDRGIIAIDLESSNKGTTIIRAGTEIVATEFFTLRGGIDRIQTEKNSNGVKPSLGFTLKKGFDGLSPSLTYAYVFEPFSGGGTSVLSISFGF
ncbi:MAG: PorV/PorQ family protein [Bacteroidota bacterium]